MAAQPKVIDLLNANAKDGKTHVSFEFFPPKTEKGEENLMAAMPDFKAQNPVFVDFTWGAGGTTADKTCELCLKTMRDHNVIVNMHLTCTNMPQGKVREALEFCKTNGITNIVALRGDPPAGQEWKASADGFSCALDLVKYIRANYGDFFSLAVAGYPEGHPEKISTETGAVTDAQMDEEMAYLKQKIEAGGDYIITQLFYDTAVFLKFVERCRADGIQAPILPGMLPMQTYGGLQRMASLCKTYLPPAVKARTEELKDDDAAFKQYGIELTTAMVKEIIEAKVCPHIHFYTLNTKPSTFSVLKNLGLLQE